MYLAVGGIALAAGARTRGAGLGLAALGAALAGTGYSVGRALLKDPSPGPPPDPLPEEVAAFGVVALAEELSWGAIVERDLGAPLTSALFAAKHFAIDRRARRTLGLILFWLGLAVIRRRSSNAAALAHFVLNVAAVAVGHWTRRDRF